MNNVLTTLRFGRISAPQSKARPSREQTVAVYGGAGVAEDTPLYRYSYQVGQALAKEGFGVLTGGGPGVMKAVAEGANAEGGYTSGVAMNFIGEAHYEGNDELEVHDTFCSRLDNGFESRAALCASLPGGIGTYQEITKRAVELYTDKTIHPGQKQIVLFEFQGFWQKFLQHLKDGPIAAGLMSPKVLELFKVVNTIPEGIKHLKNKAVSWTPGIKSPSSCQAA